MEPNNHDAQLLATHLAEREKLYQHAPFPLYGLPATWVGVRALGEMAYTEDDGAETIDYLGLTHGPHQNDEGTPRLDVITAQPGAGPPAIDLLADQAGIVLSPDSLTSDPAPLVTATCGPITAITQQVTIHGVAVNAQGLQAGHCWVLGVDIGVHRVIIAANNWPAADVHLDRISDVGPYSAGTHQLFNR